MHLSVIAHEASFAAEHENCWFNRIECELQRVPGRIMRAEARTQYDNAKILSKTCNNFNMYQNILKNSCLVNYIYLVYG